MNHETSETRLLDSSLSLCSQPSQQGEIISRAWEKKLQKLDVYEKASPLMGAIIQGNLLQQVYLLPGPAAVSPDALSHSPVSAGPLQRLVTSISFSPLPLRHNLAPFCPRPPSLLISSAHSSAVGHLARSAQNPQWLLCSINEGKLEHSQLLRCCTQTAMWMQPLNRRKGVGNYVVW